MFPRSSAGEKRPIHPQVSQALGCHLKPGLHLYFRDPRVGDERVLVHAQVESVAEDVATARFERHFDALEVDVETLVFYSPKREFLQQPARIVETVEDDEGFLVGFETTGDAVSAESREHYRVGTAEVEIDASVGGEGTCDVQDLSATGFAAVAHNAYSLGASLDVEVRYEAQICRGSATVQSIRELGQGYRYGLVSKDAGGGAFQQGLGEISLAVQREKLRRLSGFSA